MALVIRIIQYFCRMQKPVLVIKLGTAVITDEKGAIVQPVIRKIAAEIAVLSHKYRDQSRPGAAL